VGAGGGNALAAGVASMPFFASLWAKESRYELAIVVADSVSRVACLGLLGAWAMVALGRLMTTWIGNCIARVLGTHLPAHSRWTELSFLVAGLGLWSAVAVWVLRKAGSALPV